MVAVDEDRKPVAVAHLKPITVDECRRHAAAEVRREMRREMDQRFAAFRTRFSRI